MKDNIILDKSYSFALSIIHLYRDLKRNKEYELPSQILRSGTSIGAIVEEAVGGYSTKDFLNKITTSYKEARETNYWLRLLRDSETLDFNRAQDYINRCEELLRILTSIQKSTKARMKSENNS